MDTYGVKATGTKEELEAISEAFGYNLDANGVCNVEEDYRFSIFDQIADVAMDMARAAKNAKFLFRGFTDSKVSGEYIEYEIEYDGEKLTLKSTDWQEPNYDEDEEYDEDSEEESDEEGDEEDWDDYCIDWFKEGTFKDKEWDYEDVVVIAGQGETQITFAIKGATDNELGIVLTSNWPIDFDGFTDVQMASNGMLIQFSRFEKINKDDLDAFAEAISLLMPDKVFFGTVKFFNENGDDDGTYKYVCKDGDLECSKIVGETEDGFTTEPVEMRRMTEEEKQELFDSEEDDE